MKSKAVGGSGAEVVEVPVLVLVGGMPAVEGLVEGMLDGGGRSVLVVLAGKGWD